MKLAVILCFSLHTHRQIKPRLVPVHKALIDARFSDYVEFIKSKNHQRLMFDLPAKTGRYSEKVRIWFSGEGDRAGYLQKCDIPNVDQLGMKTAISSLRLNFEQQVRIYALQANSKDAFNYLMGFNEYPNSQFDEISLLNTVIQQVRIINTQLSWQRFLSRESH